MHTHAPANYDCIFCRIIDRAKLALPDTDVIYQSDEVTAFLSLSRWPKNPVDVLIVPNRHFENLYDLSERYVLPLHQVTRNVALALKVVYQCDGISTRQHNEPAGDQDVWHYHVHVTPRFEHDDFYRSHKILFPEPERLQHATQLREFLTTHA